MSLLEPHTLRCHTPGGACSVTLPKLEVSLTNSAALFRALAEDILAVVSQTTLVLLFKYSDILDI